MMCNFHGRPVGSIESKLAAKGIDVADAKANGLVDRKYSDAGTAMGATMWSGEKFKQEAGFLDFGLTDGCEAFVEEMQKGPLWVSRYISAGLRPHRGRHRFPMGIDQKRLHHLQQLDPGPTNAVEVDTLLANVFVRHITSASGSVQAFR